MMIPVWSWTLAAVFTPLGLLHLYWLLGGTRGIHAAIPTIADNKPLFQPGKLETAAVMALLWIAAFWMLLLGRELPGMLPSWLVNTGGYLISAIFLIRSVGDFRYIGFFKRYRGSPFARMDSRYYSPLCLALGASTLILLLH
ncbi:DUF3995 domain-containing protein [Paenibacillus sp. 1011MAR3C5]|uniref:DUF3995 domain-containing protein n=1 Tax=Paenibacillus sp. 1011MAR3C5 TaxID=1675787 RepID=UPI001603A64B|nr:DUF3995 domain-containing protein [Paenibacillus sp. 1011MAR3C5]